MSNLAIVDLFLPILLLPILEKAKRRKDIIAPGVKQGISAAEWGSDLKVQSARRAYERLQARQVMPHEGNPETPYCFTLPNWWKMREGVSIPSLPIGKPIEGEQGYRPARSDVFKKSSSRTMRPVVDFDTCVKCTLCWLQCPDSCFDATPRKRLTPR